MQYHTNHRSYLPTNHAIPGTSDKTQSRCGAPGAKCHQSSRKQCRENSNGQRCLSAPDSPCRCLSRWCGY